MRAKWKTWAALLLLFLVLAAGHFASPSHWLTLHGSVTCNGRPVAGAKAFRSQRGDIFVYGAGIQPAVISLPDGALGACNPDAFTRFSGLLFSRDAEPSVECTSMWKGGGSDDREPPHTVTNTHAEFPWGSCSKLRVDY